MSEKPSVVLLISALLALISAAFMDARDRVLLFFASGPRTPGSRRSVAAEIAKHGDLRADRHGSVA
ncbi:MULTISPECIES: hypothetical protein [unclassified Streptomyces]|uniref:hypothetical protein n=1 Tax=unclassified Streptomyces TaxID=2593676 RepID=UPI0033A828AC